MQNVFPKRTAQPFIAFATAELLGMGQSLIGRASKITSRRARPRAADWQAVTSSLHGRGTLFYGHKSLPTQNRKRAIR